MQHIENVRVETLINQKASTADWNSLETSTVDAIFNNDESVDPTYNEEELPTRKHRKTKTGENLFIPPNILHHPEVQSTAIRNKISPTALSSITASIISSCGGDIGKFPTSYAQTVKLKKRGTAFFK